MPTNFLIQIVNPANISPKIEAIMHNLILRNPASRQKAAGKESTGRPLFG
jgi:hypothetical protein